jgi:pimeloyl-ACP methyl ester carboxylesterase
VQATDIFATPEDAIAQMRRGMPRADEHELRHRALNNLMQREDGSHTWRYDAVLRSPDRPMPRPDPEQSWAEVRNINVPSLLMRGEHSDVLSPEVAARMQREIPGMGFVTVPDAGHSIPLDNPVGFREAVREFLG